jgi:hypothetical protein
MHEGEEESMQVFGDKTGFIRDIYMLKCKEFRFLKFSADEYCLIAVNRLVQLCLGIIVWEEI